jgi:hypothetical protein
MGHENGTCFRTIKQYFILCIYNKNMDIKISKNSLQKAIYSEVNKFYLKHNLTLVQACKQVQTNPKKYYRICKKFKLSTAPSLQKPNDTIYNEENISNSFTEFKTESESESSDHVIKKREKSKRSRHVKNIGPKITKIQDQKGGNKINERPNSSIPVKLVSSNMTEDQYKSAVSVWNNTFSKNNKKPINVEKIFSKESENKLLANNISTNEFTKSDKVTRGEVSNNLKKFKENAMRK